jgi:hypothetical protein
VEHNLGLTPMRYANRRGQRGRAAEERRRGGGGWRRTRGRREAEGGREVDEGASRALGSPYANGTQMHFALFLTTVA